MNINNIHIYIYIILTHQQLITKKNNPIYKKYINIKIDEKINTIKS